MNEQALTLLQQGRSFIRAGEPARAAGLLRRARLLAGGDEDLQIPILRELIQVAAPAGLSDEAVVWREQLTALEARRAPARAAAEPADDADAAALGRPGRSRVWLYVGVPGAVAALVIIALVWRSTTSAAGGDQPKTQPVDRQASSAEPAPPSPSPSRSQSPSARTASGSARDERERQLRDNVALVFWIQHYEGQENGENTSLDYVMGSGSAFAVHASGLMLTNRHVTSARNDVQPPDSSPPALVKVGKPVLKVCFGPDESEHFPAEILHESSTYDVAIIRVPRRFGHPFTINWDRRAAMGDSVVAVGFPGIVLQISQSADATFREGRLLELARTGSLSYRDQYPADAFNPVATRGIISSPNRSIDGAIYHLFDARIAPGSSGGPLLLEETNQVIGIVTLGGLKAGIGYNYALALPQLQDEIMRYFP